MLASLEERDGKDTKKIFQWAVDRRRQNARLNSTVLPVFNRCSFAVLLEKTKEQQKNSNRTAVEKSKPWHSSVGSAQCSVIRKQKWLKKAFFLPDGKVFVPLQYKRSRTTKTPER